MDYIITQLYGRQKGHSACKILLRQSSNVFIGTSLFNYLFCLLKKTKNPKVTNMSGKCLLVLQINKAHAITKHTEKEDSANTKDVNTNNTIEC